MNLTTMVVLICGAPACYDPLDVAAPTRYDPLIRAAKPLSGPAPTRCGCGAGCCCPGCQGGPCECNLKVKGDQPYYLYFWHGEWGRSRGWYVEEGFGFEDQVYYDKAEAQRECDRRNGKRPATTKNCPCSQLCECGCQQGEPCGCGAVRVSITNVPTTRTVTSGMDALFLHRAAPQASRQPAQAAIRAASPAGRVPPAPFGRSPGQPFDTDRGSTRTPARTPAAAMYGGTTLPPAPARATITAAPAAVRYSTASPPAVGCARG